jgi:SAM-dependent methyltransferase
MQNALGYCKVCNLADFRNPDLASVMRDLEGAGPDRPEFPAGTEHRKYWEVSMTLRALRDFGAIRDDAEILGVGAGREVTIFWLTRLVRRVFATDLYLEEDKWSATDSGAAMLIDPVGTISSAGTVRFEWNPRRLVVQHMNALELDYEDESFDGVFSSSSIEHFGKLRDIRRSVEEMYRVLKPGGVAAIATEFRLAGPRGIPGTVMFDEEQLREALLDGMSWELASPLDLSVTDETLATEIDFKTLIPDESEDGRPGPLHRIRTRLGAGRKRSEGPTQHLPTPYPHIVLRFEKRRWTSVHLALIKPARA